jgi:hypothetical protein
MFAKKKNTRKRAKSKKPATNRTKSTKKQVRKKPTARKQLSKKKASPKKATTKRGARTGSSATNTAGVARRVFSQQGLGAGAAGQSGGLQGLSRREDADSESVEELVEEGNVFEAGVVTGVEEADDAEEKEVHTHEVLEDDVPEEYLDKDS